MSKSHWILQRNEKGLWLGSQIRQRGKVFHCKAIQKVKHPEQISGKAHLCINSKKTVVTVEEFPIMKKEILQMQIRNRLDQLAFFDVGESISVSWQNLSKKGQQQTLSISALPEELVDSGMEEVTRSGRVHLVNCVSSAAAIAGLLKQLGSDSYIVLLLTSANAFLLGIRDGIPLFRQSMPLSSPGVLDPAAAVHAINFGRERLQRDFGIDECRFLCMGKGRENIDHEELGEKEWVPDWSHCLQTEGDEILLNPALFGTLFASTECSYLPAEYSVAVQLKKFAGRLAIGAAIASLVFGALSYRTYQRVTPAKESLQSSVAELNQEIEKLRQRLPDHQTTQQITAYLQLLEKVQADPSTSLLLKQIAHELPENIIPTNLTIERESPSTESAANAVMDIPAPGMEAVPPTVSKTRAEQLLEQKLIIHLNCASNGQYPQVKARFDEALSGLSSSFILQNVDWGYKEEETSGFLSCDLIPKGNTP